MASKAGILGDSNYQSIYHHLLLNVDLRGLSQMETHEKNDKVSCSARRVRLHTVVVYRILNLRKLNPDDSSLPDMRTNLLKERLNILQFMQVFENASGISISFTNKVYLPAKTTTVSSKMTKISLSNKYVAPHVKTLCYPKSGTDAAPMVYRLQVATKSYIQTCPPP